MVSSIADIMAQLNAKTEAETQKRNEREVTDELLVLHMEKMARRGFIFNDFWVRVLRLYLSKVYSGLLLYGDVGCGKTFFFYALGLPILNLKYATTRKLDEVTHALELHSEFDILVDDLGYEGKLNDWGDKKEVLSYVLDYRLQTEKRTQFTSNLPLDSSNSEEPTLRKRYLDDRIIDRIKQLANGVPVKGDSKRTTSALRMDAETFEQFFHHPVFAACKRHCAGWIDGKCYHNVTRQPTEENWRRCSARHGELYHSS